MKKTLFIMILAAILIPVTPIGASNSGMNTEISRPDTVDTQMRSNPASEMPNLSGIEKQVQSEKNKVKNSVKRSYRTKKVLSRKSISGNKRDRLFGILLLAYGGRR